MLLPLCTPSTIQLEAATFASAEGLGDGSENRKAEACQ